MGKGRGGEKKENKREGKFFRGGKQACPHPGLQPFAENSCQHLGEAKKIVQISDH